MSIAVAPTLTWGFNRGHRTFDLTINFPLDLVLCESLINLAAVQPGVSPEPGQDLVLGLKLET